MSALLRAISKDYLRSVVISAISAAIALPLFCVCVFIPLWLVNELDASIWVLIVSLAAFLVLVVLGPLGGGAWVLYRRKRWLDDIFVPLGLTGQAYMLTGREYRGMVDGHASTVRFYRGPTFDLCVSTPLHTRFSVSRREAVDPTLARLINRRPLALAEPELSEVSIFALDEDWTRALLAVPEARAALLRLLNAGESWALLQQVFLDPGAFRLRLYRNRNLFQYGCTPGEGQEWLADLLTLARIAEGLPAPQVTAEASSLEQAMRSGHIARWVLPITLATAVGIPVCGVILALMILLLTKWGN